MQCEKTAFDSQVPRPPAPIWETRHKWFELHCYFLRGPWFIFDTDSWEGIEGLHRFEVLRVAVAEVQCVQFSVLLHLL